MRQKTFFKQALLLSVFLHLIVVPCLGIFLNSQLSVRPPAKRIELELVKTVSAQALDSEKMAALPNPPPKPHERKIPVNKVISSENKIIEQRPVEPIAKDDSAVIDRTVPTPAATAETSGAEAKDTGQTAASAEGSSSDAASGGQTVHSGEYIRPQLLSSAEPLYPERARAEAREGTVAVSLEVLYNGRVGSVSVTQSSGHADLDAAAVRAVKRWRFMPAKDSLSGQAVSCFVNFPVVFQIR